MACNRTGRHCEECGQPVEFTDDGYSPCCGEHVAHGPGCDGLHATEEHQQPMSDDLDAAGSDFHAFKRGCRDRDVPEPTWGEWLRMGQPTWTADDNDRGASAQ